MNADINKEIPKAGRADGMNSKINLSIKSRDGFAAVEDVRRNFEEAVASTNALSKSVRLEARFENGVFVGYSHQDADILWVGYALGVRLCERLYTAGHAIDAHTFSLLNLPKESPAPPECSTAEPSTIPNQSTEP